MPFHIRPHRDANYLAIIGKFGFERGIITFYTDMQNGTYDIHFIEPRYSNRTLREMIEEDADILQ